MNEMRKLLEAVNQLNEYLTRGRDPFDVVLQLNVFTDLGYGLPEDEDIYTDFDEPEFHEMMNNLKAEFKDQAEELAKRVNAAAAAGKTLTDLESQAVDEAWYDGSEAYEYLETSFLAEVYERQIGLVMDMLEEDLVISGKKVDMDSLEFDDVDYRDAPDFSDAFVTKAYFEDGTALTDEQVEFLEQNFHDAVRHALDRYIY